MYKSDVLDINPNSIPKRRTRSTCQYCMKSDSTALGASVQLLL